MPELLLSVRCRSEAGAALEAGARAIDLKEPAAGPLGPLAVGEALPILDGLRALAASARPWTSAALGELAEAEAAGAGWRAHAAGVVDAFKVGLAGEARRPWDRRLEALRDALHMPGAAGPPPGPLPAPICVPSRVPIPAPILVPVAYADFREARSPDPWEILEFAASAGFELIAIDTFRKGGGSARQLLGDGALAEWTEAARARRVRVGIAGSLGLEDVAVVAAWRPALVAVRGAACEGGERRGRLDATRIRALLEALSPFAGVS